MTTRRRVVVFLPDLRGGGAERTVLGFAASLVGAHDVELVLATAADDLRDEVREGIEVVELGATRVLGSIPRFARHLRRRRPDAILSALNHANVAAVAARGLARVPARLVVAEHNHLSVATAHATSRRDRALPSLMRVAYPRADVVVAVSAGVADDLAAQIGIARAAIEVVPNPIDVDDLVARAAADTGHPWLDDPDGPPVALAVGRLTAQKDFAMLLDALALARRSRDLRLIVLGEGEERDDLRRRISRLGLDDAVQMPGFVANPYPYFRACDVFVLSSQWEGLPTVLLEAVALTGRIVSTDCPSGPAEILAEGTGSLVPVGDASAFASALVDVLRRPARARPELLEPYAPARVRAMYTRLLGLTATD